MKHVLVIPSWLECKWGAGGSFFAEQAQIMRREAGWKVNMLMPCPRSVARIWLRGLPAASGVEIETRDGMEIWIGYYPYYFMRKSPRAWREFGEKLFLQYVQKHGPPDMLWAHSIPKAGWLCLYLRQKYGVPYFIHEHLSMYGRKRKIFSPFLRARIKSAVNGAEYCAAVGENLRAAILKHIPVGGDKIRVIYNPVGFEFTATSPVSGENFIFASSCYLRPGKRVDAVIRGFAEAVKEFPRARLEIGGDGGEMKNLKLLAEKLGVSKFVRFHGHLDRIQVRDLLARAGAFVSASSIETFGVALAEALACGLPAIATKTGIAEKAINAQNGVLLKSAAPEEIAKAMRAVMRGDYDSAQIRENALREFSPRVFAERVQNALSPAI